ncbi:TetR/AcrR family transcriptional regulator [Alloalcanivorax mobilis]|uniref:TetR/AcrR family transcriptional regulator n=1 Tax=Alloalcanivorax mobilis TaxID=2019569 RepID=UPI000C75689D|nr:TetR/AcrR family transcriptional regulator [Alloalcanivorax mobilis]
MARPEKKTQIGQPPMKAQIKKAARDLFIQRGISDVSYGDIAEVVNTTRANLHYHFGNKSALIEEVFQETFDDLEAQFQEVWARPGLTLAERIALVARDCERRFREFNDTDRGRNPWSLSARVRFEKHLISERTQEGISEMSRHFEDYVAHAVKLAIGNGELRPDTPVRHVVMLITPLWYFGSLLTQHSGLKKLLDHYWAVRDIVAAAYGTGAPEPDGSPDRGPKGVPDQAA